VANDVLGLEVPDQRIEAGVVGNDVERCARGRGGEASNVIGYVEIEGVAAGALDPDVFGVRPKRLELGSELEGDFGLGGATKDLGLERASTERSEILGLNVLEVDKNNARFQLAADRFGEDATPSEFW